MSCLRHFFLSWPTSCLSYFLASSTTGDIQCPYHSILLHVYYTHDAKWLGMVVHLPWSQRCLQLEKQKDSLKNANVPLLSFPPLLCADSCTLDSTCCLPWFPYHANLSDASLSTPSRCLLLASRRKSCHVSLHISVKLPLKRYLYHLAMCLSCTSYRYYIPLCILYQEHGVFDCGNEEFVSFFFSLLVLIDLAGVWCRDDTRFFYEFYDHCRCTALLRGLALLDERRQTDIYFAGGWVEKKHSRKEKQNFINSIERYTLYYSITTFDFFSFVLFFRNSDAAFRLFLYI